jgi:cytochrome c
MSVSVATTGVQPDTANAGPALTANVGSAITFSQATATGTAPLSYAWNFGDGGTETGVLNPTYTYQTAGTYTAELLVTDALGIPAMSTVTVTVDRSNTSVSSASADSALTGDAGSPPTSS